MTSTAPYVVGVDVGSGSTRAVALDPDGAVLGVARSSHPNPSGTPGEMDPNLWLDGLVDAASGFDEAVAVGVGGYGPCTVADGGQAALTFRFPVGDVADPHDQHQAHAAELRRRHGDIAPMLQWDWLVGRLGRAGGFQSVWPGDRAIEGFGDPVSVGTPVGTTSGDLGMPEGVPLVPASNDAYLTAWAVGIDHPGRGFDPGGSTGGLGVAVASDAEAAPYGMPSAVPGVVIAGGPVAAHGGMLDWWSRITSIPIPELLKAAVDIDPGSDGLVVLPFLEGERAPRWNQSLRAEIIGLRAEHGPAIVARAILESTAYGLAHIADSLDDQGARLETLVCCGKPSQSELWTSIKASVLDVPVEVPVHQEMAAYGAALAAGSALEWWPRPGEGSSGDWPQPEYASVAPEPSDVYREQYERFVAFGDVAEGR